MTNNETESRYLDYLPAIFHHELAGRFLRAFEQVLTGVGNPDAPGLEEILDGITDSDRTRLAGVERYFDPGPDLAETERAPAEFLEWLAGWLALTLNEDWWEEERRRFLASIVRSYRKRGTPEGLREVLAAYAFPEKKGDIDILEPDPKPFQVKDHSTVGENALGHAPPHFFVVRMKIKVNNEEDRIRRERIARTIIDQEKPAHTYYRLYLEAVDP